MGAFDRLKSLYYGYDVAKERKREDDFKRAIVPLAQKSTQRAQQLYKTGAINRDELNRRVGTAVKETSPAPKQLNPLEKANLSLANAASENRIVRPVLTGLASWSPTNAGGELVGYVGRAGQALGWDKGKYLAEAGDKVASYSKADPQGRFANRGFGDTLISGGITLGGDVVNSFNPITRAGTLSKYFTSSANSLAGEMEKSGNYTPQQSFLAGSALGTANAALERIGLNKITGGAGGNVLRRIATAGATEGITEGAQQLAENTSRKLTTRPDQNLFQGVLVSTLAGGILGAGARGGVEVSTNKQVQQDTKKVAEKVNDNVNAGRVTERRIETENQVAELGRRADNAQARSTDKNLTPAQRKSADVEAKELYKQRDAKKVELDKLKKREKLLRKGIGLSTSYVDENGNPVSPSKRKLQSDQLLDQDNKTASSKRNPAKTDLTTQAVLSVQEGSQIPAIKLPQSNTKTVLDKKMENGAGLSYNTSKANVDNTTKTLIDKQVAEMQPEIEQAVGKKLSLKEAKEYAQTGDKILGSVRNRKQTLDDIAALERTQQRFLALKEKEATGKALTPKEVRQLSQDLLLIQAKKADVARQLGSMRNLIDPKEVTMRDLMIQRIAKEVDDMNPVMEAMNNYDLNDPKQATEFYRQFVKPTAEDWLDKYRYTNMLSSPWTHIVNITSNLTGGAVVRPIQKLYEGFIDSVNGGDKTRFSGESLRYMKGFFSSFGEAVDNFRGVFDDSIVTGNPDMDSLRNVALATKGKAAVADKIIGFVPKLLEAGDQFGQALVRGGETSALKYRQKKGVNVGNIAQQAQETAQYQLFRNQLGNKSEGYVLQAMDYIPQQLNQARNAKNPLVRNIAKTMFPFVSTPTNIFKQMVEYSPLGATTMVGQNVDKTAQAAKTLMGMTAVGAIAAAFGATDNITFAEPTGDERDKFRAEGKQAYSIKIGNKWYSYQRLHPAISFNFAIVGAVNNEIKNGRMDESTAEKVLNSAGNITRFMTDQSYLKNIKDFVDVVTATESGAKKLQGTIGSQVANIGSQYIPFRALQSWVNSLIDPTQRKVDYTQNMPTQIYQQIAKQLPGLSKGVPARINPYTGEPLKNDLPVVNAFSPVRVTVDKGYGNTRGLSVDESLNYKLLTPEEANQFKNGILQQKAIDRQTNKEKEKIKSESKGEVKKLANGKYYGKIGDEWKTFDSEDDYNEDKAVYDFKQGDEKIKEIGNKVYMKSDDNEQGYTVKSKTEYQFDKDMQGVSIELDKAKANNDLETWTTYADKKYQALVKKRDSYDPDTEFDKIDAVNKQLLDLEQEYEKYAERGYIKKGGKGGRSGVKTALNSAISFATPGNVATPKIKISGIKAPSGGLSIPSARRAAMSTRGKQYSFKVPSLK